MKFIEIVGDSMIPTLKPGQLVLTKSINLDKIKRYSIIAFRLKNKLLIKRLVGLPGENIELRNGTVIIDQKQDRKIWPSYSSPHSTSWKLGHDEYLVLGDNPNNSLDSRKLGPIARDSLEERVVFRLWFPKLL